jgi:DNA-binding MarR family transcriptional regulator
MSETPTSALKQDLEDLAAFRAALRRYLKFSERVVRQHGLTPQQYQLLLAVMSFHGRDWATVGELAEELDVRPNSVVELIDRAQRNGLVQRTSDPHDARTVQIALTRAGRDVLKEVSALHRDRLGSLTGGSLILPIGEASPPAEYHRSAS